MMIVSERAPLPGCLARKSEPISRKFSGPDSDVPLRAYGESSLPWRSESRYRALKAFSAPIRPRDVSASSAPTMIISFVHHGDRAADTSPPPGPRNLQRTIRPAYEVCAFAGGACRNQTTDRPVSAGSGDPVRVGGDEVVHRVGQDVVQQRHGVRVQRLPVVRRRAGVVDVLAVVGLDRDDRAGTDPLQREDPVRDLARVAGAVLARVEGERL